MTIQILQMTPLTGLPQKLSQSSRSFDGVFKDFLPKIRDKIYRNCITLKLNTLVEYEKDVLGVIHAREVQHNFCSLLPLNFVCIFHHRKRLLWSHDHNKWKKIIINNLCQNSRSFQGCLCILWHSRVFQGLWKNLQNSRRFYGCLRDVETQHWPA